MGWIEFKCEQMPAFCFYFGRVGHVDKSCTTRKQDLLNGSLTGGQYGEWISAENVKTMRRNSNDDREHERKTPLRMLAESRNSSENGNEIRSIKEYIGNKKDINKIVELIQLGSDDEGLVQISELRQLEDTFKNARRDHAKKGELE